MMSTRKGFEFGETSDVFQSNFHRFRLNPFLEGRSIAGLLVGDAVLPAAENDAHPLERKSSYGSVVRLVAFPLLIVKGSRPLRFPGRHPGPFVKGLAQKLRTGPPPVHPFPFATAFRDRSDTGIALDGGGRGVTFP